jgi:lysozyme family protein
MAFYLDPRIRGILLDALAREGWAGGRAKARHQAADRGGLTRGGMTATNWGRYKQLGRLATADELNAITEDEALEFYYTEYCLALHFDQVLDQQLRALLIDWAFTSYDDPAKALQASLKARGLYAGKLDGVIGPQTIAALRADREPKRLFQDVFIARIKHYVKCAWDAPVRHFLKANRETQLHNLPGWINRSLELLP